MEAPWSALAALIHRKLFRSYEKGCQKVRPTSKLCPQEVVLLALLEERRLDRTKHQDFLNFLNSSSLASKFCNNVHFSLGKYIYEMIKKT